MLVLFAALTAVAAPPPAKKAAAPKAKGKIAPKARYTRRWTPPPRPVGPMQPSAERYKEIQQSLIDRGYFAGEPSGEWKPDSVEALKRFQQDQKLEANGKLDSLSIIALGLGPKRTAAAAAPPSPAAPKEP